LGFKKIDLPTISPGEWSKPKMFSTPALAKVLPALHRDPVLANIIPKLAANQNNIVLSENAEVLGFPVKPTLCNPSTKMEAMDQLKIMKNYLSKIRKHLMETFNWIQWHRASIANHKLIKNRFFYYVSGVDARFWDLSPSKDEDLITIFKNIGFVTLQMMSKEKLQECIETSPKWHSIETNKIGNDGKHIYYSNNLFHKVSFQMMNL